MMILLFFQKVVWETHKRDARGLLRLLARKRERDDRSIDRTNERTTTDTIESSSRFFSRKCASRVLRRNTRKTRGKSDVHGADSSAISEHKSGRPRRRRETKLQVITTTMKITTTPFFFPSLSLSTPRGGVLDAKRRVLFLSLQSSRFDAAVMRCLSFLFVFPKATTTTLTDDDDGLFQRHVYFSVERGKRPSCTTIGTFFGTAAWHSRGRNWMHPS